MHFNYNHSFQHRCGRRPKTGRDWSRVECFWGGLGSCVHRKSGMEESGRTPGQPTQSPDCFAGPTLRVCAGRVSRGKKHRLGRPSKISCANLFHPWYPRGQYCKVILGYRSGDSETIPPWGVPSNKMVRCTSGTRT